ncbi:hypothetical protein GMORB2_6362 [Geosmithia morbida]|uniref:Uncharacterized protein n=1 Tax=Geosmithia morbida TaxID=1094350 RepID=A0A9P5D4L2_9HYPO|nr:uncharacterized protein GMORB2_6362 [Geosmithia morbida]KAF4123661.1 hypothetical protein GMORB2_6362 [Geosmithia morbida]
MDDRGTTRVPQLRLRPLAAAAAAAADVAAGACGRAGRGSGSHAASHVGGCVAHKDSSSPKGPPQAGNLPCPPSVIALATGLVLSNTVEVYATTAIQVTVRQRGTSQPEARVASSDVPLSAVITHGRSYGRSTLHSSSCTAAVVGDQEEESRRGLTSIASISEYDAIVTL